MSCVPYPMQYACEMRMRTLTVVVFLACFGPLFVRAQEDSTLDAQLKAIAAAHHGEVTLFAHNLKTGQTARLKPDELVKTASVIKLGILLDAAEQIRAATANHSDPSERLKIAVELLFEASRPDPTAKRPLFTDFAPRLLVSHPEEVKVAHAPLVSLLTELMEAASEAGELRDGVNPKRIAAMTMQTVMFIAQSNGGSDDETMHPITSDEVWDFCSRGFARD